MKNGGCLDSAGSYQCLCNPGWKLGANDKDCIDVDECSSPLLNECEHICNNTAGSYTCNCNEGYKLTFNAYSKLNSDCERMYFLLLIH